MNIRFSYLYRDGANYKNYGDIVYHNPHERSLSEIDKKIKQHLINGLWFVATHWGLEDLYFAEYGWDEKVDHTWHEFIEVTETPEGPCSRSIEDLLSSINQTKVRGQEFRSISALRPSHINAANNRLIHRTKCGE